MNFPQYVKEAGWTLLRLTVFLLPTVTTAEYLLQDKIHFSQQSLFDNRSQMYLYCGEVKQTTPSCFTLKLNSPEVSSSHQSEGFPMLTLNQLYDTKLCAFCYTSWRHLDLFYSVLSRCAWSVSKTGFWHIFSFNWSHVLQNLPAQNRLFYWTINKFSHVPGETVVATKTTLDHQR